MPRYINWISILKNILIGIVKIEKNKSNKVEYLVPVLMSLNAVYDVLRDTEKSNH